MALSGVKWFRRISKLHSTWKRGNCPNVSCRKLLKQKLTHESAAWKQCIEISDYFYHFQNKANATWEKCNMKSVQHKKSSIKLVQYGKEQHEQSLTGKEWNMKKVQHEKGATRKRCNMSIAKHENSATRKSATWKECDTKKSGRWKTGSTKKTWKVKEIAKNKASAILKKCNMKKVQYGKSSTWRKCNIKNWQQKKRATRHICTLEKAKHGKSASSKSATWK